FLGAFEVVARHVAAEDTPGEVVVPEERRAGEANERGVGERQPHVAGKLPGLRAMRFVRHHDDVIALAVWLFDLLVQLVYEAEHEPVVLLKYPLQDCARAGSRRLLIGDAAADKGAQDLVVQILAVGTDEEIEIPRYHA